MGVKRALLGRPLPLQVPTAFVRIRRRGLRVCGEARTERHRRCPPAQSRSR